MNMSTVLICPYFGKLPNYFEYVLKSCEYNKKINWILITDDKRKFNYPKNVRVIYMEFYEFRNLIQKNFEFMISLKTPYKLCDYKPIYGYVMRNYIKEYEYWGHCDIDCFFGDLFKFIEEPMKLGVDKIGYLGHLTLYKNRQDINERFKLPLKGKNFKDVFTTDEILVFDESFTELSMNTIYEHYGFEMYKKPIFADISCLYYDFRLYKYNEKFSYKLERRTNRVFIWEEGKVWSEIKDGEKEEFGYVHFQKRSISIPESKIESRIKFLLRPNEICLDYNIDKELKIKYRKLFYKPYFNQKIKAIKFRLRRKRNEN